MKIFHHDDHDGYLSKFWAEQAIALNLMPPDEFGVKSQEMSYEDSKDQFPFNEIQKDEVVIVLDFKITPEDYEKFYSITKNLIWIDHHGRTINTVKEYCVANNKKMPSGFQIDGVSGSALTALYFFANLFVGHSVSTESEIKDSVSTLPLFSQYVNDFDLWLKRIPDSEYFIFATNHKFKDMEFWKTCFSSSCIDSLVTLGREIYNITIADYEEKCKRFKYIVEVTDPKYKEFHGLSILMLNSSGKGSMKFGTAINSYDVCIGYTIIKDTVSMGLYSTNKKIDCSKLANVLDEDGGGHPGASGCRMSTGDFFKVFKDVRKK